MKPVSFSIPGIIRRSGLWTPGAAKLTPGDKPHIIMPGEDPDRATGDLITRIADDVRMMNIKRRFMGENLTFGPNFVHAYIIRGASGIYGRPGQVENLGWAHNLKTTVGMDWLHNTMGGILGLGDQTATGSSGTSITKSGATWTTNQWTGFRVIADNSTNAPVYGNIGSNTSTAITVDQWWNGDDTLGTTPSTSAHFMIVPGQGPARFIGLTTDTGAPATGDTTLASEITTNGLARALATFAHTGGTTTFTLSKTFTASGSFTAVHKGGLFTSATNASAGILVADTVMNADATLASGDSLALTWTWTLPAAG